MGQKVRMIAWVMPFVSILAGVMVVLYAGWATPSETAGVGAVLAMIVVGSMYKMWQPARIMPILTGTLRESTMLLMIVGMSLLYAYVMSYLHISQAGAEWVISLGLSKWVLLTTILVFVVVLGFFLPPVSIILMTAPIILPPLKAANFDLIWFGVVMTIVMEMGLIHPPVGLNIFRHQEHCARYSPGGRDVGHVALRPADDPGRGVVLHRARHRDAAAAARVLRQARRSGKRAHGAGGEITGSSHA